MAWAEDDWKADRDDYEHEHGHSIRVTPADCAKCIAEAEASRARWEPIGAGLKRVLPMQQNNGVTDADIPY